MRKFRYLGTDDKIFYIIVYTILTLFFIAVLYPCIFVVSASFSSGDAIQAGKVVLFPVDFSLEGYKTVFRTKDVLLGFRNSLFYTVVGTLLSLTLTMMAACALSRKDLPGRNSIMMFFSVTMFFSGGMIPLYMVVKQLHMINTIWAILLPGAFGVYNMIMARTFIQTNIPDEMLDAARIDGCSDIKFITAVVVPLSKTIIAVLVLFYGVAMWNSYFSALIYLHDDQLYPLTLFLREILVLEMIDLSTITDPELQAQLAKMAAGIKYALIIVSMIPILIIYPLIQKHIVKGMMIGAIKG
ncbi:MAG: carbohydrate ABC transporter permease [Lachnospiraceae bacterium]|nr:carbohydrate ABC transporter permease [Lachnospiraceae bacterium]